MLLALAWLVPMADAEPLPDRSGTTVGGDDRLARRIAPVENGLPPIPVEGEPSERSLAEWMEALAVPGLGVAVIDDYRIAWAKGYGVAEAGGSEPVTAGTLFQAASIAKPVTALAVLREVERGSFGLDTDVNQLLRSWKLPESGIAAGEKVTLRHLLAHTAGITPGGFFGYAADEPWPSLVQILEGEPPASNDPARVVGTPGSEVAYSGLGYTILQLLLVERFDKPFPEILRQIVLEPLGMGDSTCEQRLPAALSRRAASGHRATGAVVEGGWRRHPEMAAAGLWSTPSDLAKLLIEVAHSKAGRSNRVLSGAMTRQMLTQHLDQMGLGFVVHPDSEHGQFSHSGGNQGFRSHMRMLADVGKGIVVMTNSDAGSLLFSPLILSVAREYGWPGYEGREVPAGTVEGIAAQLAGARKRHVEIEVAPAVLARYVGSYELAPGLRFDVALEGGRLTVQLGDQPRFPVFPESPTRFFFKVVDAQLTFVEDDTGAVSALILHQGGRDQTAPKVE